LQELQSTPERRPHAMVQLVARIRGVGIETAAMLVNEVLLRNLARYADLHRLTR
jgi:transposase